MSFIKRIVNKTKFEDVMISAWGLWGIYGGVRGWKFYDTEYKIKNEYFDKNKKEFPNHSSYSEEKRPKYFYLTRGLYTVSGVAYYTIPPLNIIFTFINELYRLETCLRKLENNKKDQFYYNPFYPLYYSSKY